LQANTESSIILIRLTAFTQQTCKLYLDPGGGKKQINLWRKRILVKCFLLQDIQACRLEHGIWGVTNIVNTAASSLFWY